MSRKTSRRSYSGYSYKKSKMRDWSFRILAALLALIVFAGAILLHFEINNSVIDYLLLTFKQYNIFG